MPPSPSPACPQGRSTILGEARGGRTFQCFLWLMALIPPVTSSATWDGATAPINTVTRGSAVLGCHGLAACAGTEPIFSVLCL